MNRLAAIAGILLFSFALSLAAEEKIVSTRVYTDPVGAQFLVDGVAYTKPQTFLWPEGSKHTLSVIPTTQDYNETNTRYVFQGWSDSSGILSSSAATISVTASPDISWFRAEVIKQYAVTILLIDCAEGVTCDSPGTVEVGGTSYRTTTTIYVDAGAQLSLVAFPATGFVFTGWQFGAGTSDAFATTVTISAPMSIQPHFRMAKKITFKTSPAELRVLADRQPLITPVTVDWGQGTRHVIGAPSPQDDINGTTWVFDSWAHGAGQNALYSVAETIDPVTLTANFVRGARVNLYTNPAGLKLKVDGRVNWQSYSFTWAVGSTHEIAPIEDQTDASGRRYVFKDWSIGGPATQNLTVSSSVADTGQRVVANFEAMNRVTVNSTPSGLNLIVAGAECKTPCTVERKTGETVRISAPASIQSGERTRLDFAGWADGGSAERVWTSEVDGKTLTAQYTTKHLLVTLVEPEGGATIRLDPASTDNYFSEGTAVQVTAEPAKGFKFRAWDGDLSGTSRSGVVSLTGPKAVRAWLDRVPYLPDAAVRNAAGDTPVAGVAAGSLISVMGASLAADYAVGPVNPLSQTISGVTLRSGDWIFPLLFVSPSQVNAQLPSGLAEGTHKLTLRWEGQAEVSVDFEVVRNAPGLFSKTVNDRPFAVATHADGQEVTVDNPAKAGETVSLFGTGFGPYLRLPPDGFAAPEVPTYPLEDAVTVIAGEASIEPAFAGAAAGQTGTVVVRFAIPDTLPAAATIDLKVRVNGQESNTVQLPIQQPAVSQ